MVDYDLMMKELLTLDTVLETHGTVSLNLSSA